MNGSTYRVRMPRFAAEMSSERSMSAARVDPAHGGKVSVRPTVAPQFCDQECMEWCAPGCMDMPNPVARRACVNFCKRGCGC